ncbi:hypothetical protein LE181_27275 [Streptomyces sp. SCA3-4]|uniref:hypothetical protein n=1 Tax=Streptomyces sichuanensis TaxID=2871810 RepID=UPI001CE3670F|nr:hypothetical protein [Streptomyces sichuanensis]MCA6095851.1 hypothetical protein [Streptomyces sichuanensis]
MSVPDDVSCLTYHLRPPNGGNEWSALADASTLRPAYTVTHATPAGRLSYDPRAAQGALPIVLHHEDGTSEEMILVVSYDELSSYADQLEAWAVRHEGVNAP